MSNELQELSVTYAPIVVSLLAAWALARKGRITVAFLVATGAPFFLWLIIARLQHPDPNWCRYDTCPFGPYVHRVLREHYLFTHFAFPIGLALTTAQYPLRQRKTVIALAAGTIALIIYWAAMVWLIFDTCDKCMVFEPTCCELTGLGVILYAVFAIFEILLILLVGFLWRRSSHHRERQPN